jgi:glycosyltransferase involved in cell wall biosynthesis
MVNSERISLAHFTLNNCGKEKGEALAGVERVIDTQQGLLQGFGIDVRIVVGETDCEDLPRRNIILVPEIRSNPDWSWKNGDAEIDEAQVALTLQRLTQVFENSGVVFHNTTNASKHNVPFGVAAARYVSEHPNAVIWVHDLRGASGKQLQLLLPDRKLARLVCVSSARRNKVEEMLKKIQQEEGIRMPEYELLVVPNPIDAQFFRQDIPQTDNLRVLAPNYEQFARSNGLYFNPQLAERLLFEDDTVRFLVPARIVRNKGIDKAIKTAREYSAYTGEQVAVIITGPADLRKAENQQYWHQELLPVLQGLNGRGNFHVLALGGVAWEYMPFLGTRSHALLAPFENEGFCMPLIENGLMGVPSIINRDEAMIETTGGHALIVSPDDWGAQRAAQSIHRYLTSEKVSLDIRAIKEKAWGQLHPNRVAEQIVSAVNMKNV